MVDKNECKQIGPETYVSVSVDQHTESFALLYIDLTVTYIAIVRGTAVLSVGTCPCLYDVGSWLRWLLELPIKQ
jgi:hypothetical protein